MIKDTARLIYIMGRGHSGSTVLDAILGNASEIESIGEFVSGIGRVKGLCSCGVPFYNCEFWQRVRSEFEKNPDALWDLSKKLLIEQAHISQWITTLLGKKTSKSIQELCVSNQAFINAISTATGKMCVVDSSKEHTRGFFIARFLPNAKIIHLIRNPEGILASNLYRIRKGRGFKFLRRTCYNRYAEIPFLFLSSISWMVGNVLAQVIRIFASEKILRVRYEDLCANPRRELNHISAFIGCNLSDVIDLVECGQPLNVGHNIGGNHMRFAGEFVFDSKSGEKYPLPTFYRILVRLMNWPYMFFYGYPVFRGFR